jgi:membrane peptidoglycan carboxypeptidase
VSSNRAAAQLLQQVGVATAIRYAHRLGIESDLPIVPSLALGTGEVTLLELTAAYSAFANEGVVAEPRLILRVEDPSGAAIWHASERRSQAISPTTAYLMSSMLSDVVTSGTGAGARAAGFVLPAGGKTGTTDDYADAWFIGYTPHLLTGVWFGLDRPAPIMREGFGGIVAVPAWARFMRAATHGARPDWYPMPPDVERVPICRLSGARAGAGCRRALVDDAFVGPSASAPDPSLVSIGVVPPEPAVYEDLFPRGAIPSDTCPVHEPAAPGATPLVDAALAPSSRVELSAPGPAIRDVSTRLVDRISTGTGAYATVARPQ